MLISLLATVLGSLVFATAVEAKSSRRAATALRSRQDGPAGYINATDSGNGQVKLSISTQGGGRNATAPLLYGWQYEDINVCIILCLDEERDQLSLFYSTLARVDYMQK